MVCDLEYLSLSARSMVLMPWEGVASRIIGLEYFSGPGTRMPKWSYSSLDPGDCWARQARDARGELEHLWQDLLNMTISPGRAASMYMSMVVWTDDGRAVSSIAAWWAERVEVA